jgi:phosphatidylserine/phosphatidylglycerophosphate/cardiolipin synthase-like enzyme
VGSANLNNRSFGFDTEIELAVACESDEARGQAAALLNRLVGHFIGYTGEAVAKARAERGGLVHAIDHLNREGRLRPVDPSRSHHFAEIIAVLHLGDPVSPQDSWRLGRRRERLFGEARALGRP